MDLFGETLRIDKMRKIFESVDTIRKKYGKHTVCLGSSFLANAASQHANERADLSERSKYLLPGETKRKRLGILVMRRAKWCEPFFHFSTEDR